MLSWASFLAFFATLGLLLLHPVLRGWFEFLWTDNLETNRYITLCGLIFTLLFSWAITLICSRRPGPWAPRYWTLSLSLFTIYVAVNQLLFRDWEASYPLMDAFTAASFAATLALSPRLIRLHPSNPLTQRIAPLSLALILLLMFPSLLYTSNIAEQFQRKGFQAKLASMNKKSQGLSNCVETNRICDFELLDGSKELLKNMVEQVQWQDSSKLMAKEEDFDTARNALLDSVVMAATHNIHQQMDKASLDSVNLAEFKDILPLAAGLSRLGEDSQAYLAYTSLIDKIIATLKEGTEKLHESSVIYDATDGPWPLNNAFIDKSQKVIAYHRALGNLYHEIGDMVSEEPQYEALSSAYSQHLGWQQAIAELDKSWARHWLVSYIDPQVATNPKSLSDILDLSVFPDLQLSAKDNDGLLGLSKRRAEENIGHSNCEWMPTEDQKEKSLRCRTYSVTGNKVTLRVELRLVYANNNNALMPLRLLYFLPIPSDRPLPTFINEVQDALPVSNRPLNKFLTTSLDEANKDCKLNDQQRPYPPCVKIPKFTGQQQYIRVLLFL
ncbi:hypothetical protein CEK71_21100 [Methylovulum psychrotolerans]|uniref:Uncharacterized protein n=2 Tax=Methylovulum psychrotolerans TaxID=1704499 RepID=A0A1Z4C475_9GAMM|nr:hypothetical protein CEK71_21100 [Methylovulum psychrotolerans]